MQSVTNILYFISSLQGMTIFVFIRDDDSDNTTESHHDHIDSLFDQLTFTPDSQELIAQVHDFEWDGKTK